MKVIVLVDEKTGRVTIKNPDGIGDPKVFTFDQSYGELSTSSSNMFRLVPI